MQLLKKIRKKLIDSGSLKKYMLYALGEIFLIVIGILIAWKINDLNEIRKNKIVELKIYNSLYDELNVNLKILNEAISKNSDNLKRLEATLLYFGKNDSEITPGAKDTILQINYQPVNLLDGALNSVISTTKFELIESDTLKSLITNYPSELSSFRVIDSSINLVINNHVQPKIEEYLSLTDILAKDKPKFENIRYFAANSYYGKLLKDKSYQNGIIDRYLKTEQLLTHAKKLRNRTQVMALSLKEELGYSTDN